MNQVECFDELVNRRRSVRLYNETADFDKQVVWRSLNRALLAPNSSNLQLWEFYRVRKPELKEQLAEACLSQPAATSAREMVVIVTRLDLWQERANWNLEKLKAFFDKKGVDIASTNTAGDETQSSEGLLQRMSGDKRAQQISILEYYSKLIPMVYRVDRLGILGLIKKVFSGCFISGGKPSFRELSYHDRRISAHKSAALAAQTFMLSMTAEGYDTCALEGFDSRRIRQLLNLPRGAEINLVITCGLGKSEGVYNERMRLPAEQVLFDL